MLENESLLREEFGLVEKKVLQCLFLLTCGIVFDIYPLLLDAAKFGRWSLKTE
jgi:hypothetical protein